MAIDITKLQAAVAQETTVQQSAIVLLGALTTEIKSISAGTTDAATQASLDALVATMNTNNPALAAAVAQNTPAAPTS